MPQTPEQPIGRGAHRIACVLPNWVGDTVMATPALRAIRRARPRARILHVGRGISLAALEGCPWADEVLEDTSAGGGSPAELLCTAGRLRNRSIDLAILFPNSFRSALLARLGGCRRVAGYRRDGRGVLLTDPLEPPRTRRGRRRVEPMFAYYARLARAVGAAEVDNRMALPLTARHEAEADALFAECGLDAEGPVVMLNPGGSFGPSKMWQPQRYGELADRLIERTGARIILNVAPSEREIGLRIERAMAHTPHLSFARRDNSLGLLRSLVRRCDLMVTNDTGTRHFAAALGTDLVTLFGSTDPQWTTLDYDRERIVRVELPCSPCQQPVCPQPAGPLYHKCMGDITVDRVLATCLELLADRRAEVAAT